MQVEPNIEIEQRATNTQQDHINPTGEIHPEQIHGLSEGLDCREREETTPSNRNASLQTHSQAEVGSMMRGEIAASGGPKEKRQVKGRLRSGEGSKDRREGEVEGRRGTTDLREGRTEVARWEEPTAPHKCSREGDKQGGPAGPSFSPQLRDNYENQGEPGGGTQLTVAAMEVELDHTIKGAGARAKPNSTLEVILETQLNHNNRDNVYKDIMASIGLDSPTPSHDQREGEDLNNSPRGQVMSTPIRNSASSLIALGKHVMTPRQGRIWDLRNKSILEGQGSRFGSSPL